MTGKTKVDYTGSKQRAIEQFRRRRRLATGIEKVDNSALHAGAPMYFYCRHCGLPTEMLPEDYVFPPTTECSQCRGLRNVGWLEEAVKEHRKMGVGVALNELRDGLQETDGAAEKKLSISGSAG